MAELKTLQDIIGEDSHLKYQIHAKRRRYYSADNLHLEYQSHAKRKRYYNTEDYQRVVEKRISKGRAKAKRAKQARKRNRIK